MADQRNTNFKAEEEVVGRLLGDPGRYYEIANRVSGKDFANPVMGTYFESVAKLLKEGKTVNQANFMHVNPGNSQAAFDYVSLLGNVDDPGDMVEFVDIVVEMSRKRALTATLAALEKKVDELHLPDALQLVHKNLMEHMGLVDTPDYEVDKIAERVVQDLSKAFTEGTRPGMTTGFAAFDELVGAIMPEQLLIIGGATSSGKTALAQGAIKRLVDQQVRAAFFTLEMSADEIVTRFLSHMTGISASRITNAELNAEEYERVLNARHDLNGAPLDVISMSRATPSSILAEVERLRRVKGIEIVAVDHLHYVNPDEKHRSEFEAINQNVRDFKAAAKSTKIPWMVLSQLNRSLNDRQNKRPRLQDLFGGSEIEKSADTVLFVHRPQYFLEMEEPPEDDPMRADWDANMRRWKGRAELVLAKRRGGKGRGVRECRFVENTTHFEDI
jgi:replicative DNA helicase